MIVINNFCLDKLAWLALYDTKKHVHLHRKVINQIWIITMKM